MGTPPSDRGDRVGGRKRYLLLLPEPRGNANPYTLKTVQTIESQNLYLYWKRSVPGEESDATLVVLQLS